MASLPVYNLEKKKVSSMDVADNVFAGEVKPHLLNDAVRHQIAKRHERKTANALTRTEVHGTTKKVYRQKGTGQARHGAVTAPIFVGGGKAHGPRTHIRKHKMNKKAMRSALISALSMQQKEDRLFIIDKLEMDKVSTKEVSKALVATFGLAKALVVNHAADEKEKNFNQSLRNVPHVKCIRPEGVNVFDLLKFENVVVSQKAAQQISERLSNA